MRPLRRLAYIVPRTDGLGLGRASISAGWKGAPAAKSEEGRMRGGGGSRQRDWRWGERDRGREGGGARGRRSLCWRR